MMAAIMSVPRQIQADDCRSAFPDELSRRAFDLLVGLRCFVEHEDESADFGYSGRGEAARRRALVENDASDSDDVERAADSDDSDAAPAESWSEKRERRRRRREAMRAQLPAWQTIRQALHRLVEQAAASRAASCKRPQDDSAKIAGIARVYLPFATPANRIGQWQHRPEGKN